MSSYWRGHEIEFVNDQWVYSVNKNPVKENPSIFCGHCGKYPTVEGHDGCLGTIPGIKNACCGHGEADNAYVQFYDDTIISGEEAIVFFKEISMKVIIAGGRDYKFTPEDISTLDSLHSGYHFTEVVSGGAMGADRCGEIWAASNDIPVKQFPADWKKHGRAAGPIRNRQMAEYADAVILFPGGQGTANMRSLAVKYGLDILWEG